MKIAFLEKIVGKIQHEIACPKCKNVFAKGSIEICSLSPRRLDFTSRCHICGAICQIVADINIQDAGQNLPGTSFINPAKVRNIGQQISHFKSQNVKDLFC